MRTGITVSSLAVAGALATAAVAPAREVAYLGVATEPVASLLGRHLKLGEGVGLEVVHVDENSEAAGKIEVGDILHKLDDQILVNPAQLAVLVRRMKPGQNVRIELMRDGKAQAVEARLGSRDSRELPPIGGPHVWSLPAPGLRGQWRDEWERMMDQFRERMQRGWRRWPPSPPDEEGDAPPQATEPPQVRVHTSSSAVITESSGGLTLTLTVQDGHRSVRIQKGSDVVFEGPVNSDAELRKVPEEYRERVAEMQNRFRINVRGTDPQRTGQRPGNVL